MLTSSRRGLRPRTKPVDQAAPRMRDRPYLARALERWHRHGPAHCFGGAGNCSCRCPPKGASNLTGLAGFSFARLSGSCDGTGTKRVLARSVRPRFAGKLAADSFGVCPHMRVGAARFVVLAPVGLCGMGKGRDRVQSELNAAASDDHRRPAHALRIALARFDHFDRSAPADAVTNP